MRLSQANNNLEGTQFVLLPQLDHLLFDRYGDHQEFLYLVLVLAQLFILLFLQVLEFVELGISPVLAMDLQLDDVFVVHESLVSFQGLVLQDFQFILHDFDSFLELSQVLRRVLNEIHIFVPGTFHFFIQGLKTV